MKTHNYEHWIETYLGHPIDPLNPEPERIHVMDIIHSLSNQCRFSGHTREFYSVGQHSVLVSQLLAKWGCDTRIQALGLFHDGSEAYLMDMPTPIKRQMPEYRRAETPLQLMVEDVLFPEFPHDEWRKEANILVKDADLILLATEARDLMRDPKDWKVLQGVKPLDFEIIPAPPAIAKAFFIDYYKELILNFDFRASRQI